MFKAFPETNFVFLCPPSIEELHQRLIKRGTDREDQIKIRLKNAEIEIAECLKHREIIRYRLVNIDQEVTTKTFIKLFEALYARELSQ